MLIFTIYDEDGNAIRKLSKEASKGLNRISWDLRYPSTRPISASAGGSGRGRSSGGSGLLVMPGSYSVGIDMLEKGDVIAMVEPAAFDAKLLQHASLPVKNYKELVAFQKEVSELSRVMTGAQRLAQEQQGKLAAIKKALVQTPKAGTELGRKVFDLEDLLSDIQFAMDGPGAKASWEELSPMNMPLSRRLNLMIRTHWSSTSEMTQTETDQLEILKEDFPPVLAQLEKVVEEIAELDQQLEQLKAPWTPGRVPIMD